MDGTAGRHQLDPEIFRDTFMELARQTKIAVQHLSDEDLEIKIVLLGDIFDVIRTEKWFISSSKDKSANIDLENRPWGGTNKKTEMIADDILMNIIKENHDIISILSGKEWKKLGFPKRPEIIYIPGNHDRLCNVYPSMRKQVIDALELHVISETDTFPNVYKNEKHGVFARHGHELDPFNFEGDFDNPLAYWHIPIGDVIAAEIASKLPIVVGEKLKETTLPKDDIVQICNNFRNLFDVRPVSSIIPWLSFQVKRYEKYGSTVQNAINSAFRQIGEEFMDIPFVKEWIKKHDHFWHPLDNGDKVQLLGSILKTFDITNSEWKLKLFDKWETIKELWGEDKYLKGAINDLAVLSETFQYVLYGHTHDPFKQTIDIFNENEKTKQIERVYINTGTWRPCYHQSLNENGFSKWNNLTFTIIYKPGEIFAGKKVVSPVVEIWTGAMNK
jgi:UDP-2,3-diacylglucosamine pyrophosphatase LpxH